MSANSARDHAEPLPLLADGSAESGWFRTQPSLKSTGT